MLRVRRKVPLTFFPYVSSCHATTWHLSRVLMHAEFPSPHDLREIPGQARNDNKFVIPAYFVMPCSDMASLSNVYAGRIQRSSSYQSFARSIISAFIECINSIFQSLFHAFSCFSRLIA